MKMSRLISMVLLGAALVATPVYAQRGGGGSRGGGSSHSGGGSHSSSYSGGGRSGGYSSSSYSSGRSGSSYSSPSRSSSSYSSSSRSSSSYSSSSRSTSSSRSSSGYYTPTQSSSSNYTSPGRSTSTSRSTGSSTATRGTGSSYSGNRGSSSDYTRSRTGSIPSEIRSRTAGTTASGRGSVTTNGRPSGVAPAPAGGYARPGHPGAPMPPSHHHMHPAPYFYHPHHHCMVHCHQLYWDPCFYHHYYWPGFWLYCNSYWYDYHVTDVMVVRQYVRDTYKMDLITYAVNGDYMYALVNDPDGHTYIQIYDKNDTLLAEQQVSRKYCKMEVDAQNGGCWIMKKRDKDALLFLYADGQLFIYEAD